MSIAEPAAPGRCRIFETVLQQLESVEIFGHLVGAGDFAIQAALLFVVSNVASKQPAALGRTKRLVERGAARSCQVVIASTDGAAHAIEVDVFAQVGLVESRRRAAPRRRSRPRCETRLGRCAPPAPWSASLRPAASSALSRRRHRAPDSHCRAASTRPRRASPVSRTMPSMTRCSAGASA